MVSLVLEVRAIFEPVLAKNPIMVPSHIKVGL